jgi:outer membrane protein assembly factor BamD
LDICIFAPMLRKTISATLFIGLLIIISSCSKYQQLMKSSDYEQKYERGVVYYNQGDYYKALQLFDAVLPFFRGTDKAEQLAYYYAYCHYYQGDHILASYYFEKFTKSFPSSKHAEECLYMSAKCKYLDSPVYSLDQTSTYEAINDLQLFLDVYPNSERTGECNELIEQLRHKLEKKEYEIAKLYLKMSNYLAAITTFNNLLKDFPDTDFREDALYGLAKANYYYAANSISAKKKERLQNAVEAYDAFVRAYPDSNYLKQAGVYYKNAKKQFEN